MGQRQQKLLKEVTGPQRWFMKTIPVFMCRLSQVSVPQETEWVHPWKSYSSPIVFLISTNAKQWFYIKCPFEVTLKGE